MKSLNKRKSVADTAIARLKKSNPDARCELYYKTPFQLLVSVMLSAQTTDKSVNRCMQPFYDRGLDILTVLDWGERGIYERIKTIGLARTKAKNVFRLAQRLEAEFGGEVPATREALESFSGVGRKTANVVLGELFGQPTLAVDTHVFRVSKRLGLQAAASPEKAEAALMQIIDARHLPKAHHWFILHGRYTCKARRPMCNECVLSDICPSREKSNS